MKKLIRLVLITTCLTMTACSESPTEDILKSHIQTMEDAIETKRPKDALEFIHDNFHTDKSADKDWIKRTLLMYKLRHDNISITTSSISIDVKDEYTAIANFTALVAGGSGLIPKEGAIYQVQSEWRKEENDWQIVYAKWQKNLQ